MLYLSRLTYWLSIFVAAVFIPVPQPVSALPEMTASEIVNWSRNNPVIAPLQFTEKYESGYSDYSSEASTSGGSVNFSVFLDKDGLVESETADYRPECYASGVSDCYGIMRFEKSVSNGRNLIKAIWGQRVLGDFLASKLMATDSKNGTQRWYQGKLHNYETWHYNNYTISHFSIVSKKSPQPKRIKEYRYCLQNYCG